MAAARFEMGLVKDKNTVETVQKALNCSKVITLNI